ncbi:phytanoyl-CoA dioxygenase family protein [Thioalkalivibrio sp. HK1]|uniref:phytanoyl-CoA dioxygenase family protein n=1 Tax=Thioalkalivibrio sp. HK1 TaxID=1469245 RepID=UPI00046EC28E|nr:phytanoyl-CoA dioxygenase family protein [Thioalkalivibrio sp. HK1]
MIIDPSLAMRFRRQGYLVLPDAVEPSALAMLRRICDTLLTEPADDDLGGTAHDIGRGEDRRFLRHRHRDFPALAKFVLAPSMKALAAPLVGDRPCLFNEQFVVKGRDTGAAFGWHQDSGYVGFDHAPYLTVWIALDDCDESNGTLYLLARDIDRETSIEPHRWDPESKEQVGYHGEEPGIPVIVDAGAMVVFSSLTMHRSGCNITPDHRRAYLVQYSDGPLIDPKTEQPKRFATAL